MRLHSLVIPLLVLIALVQPAALFAQEKDKPDERIWVTQKVFVDPLGVTVDASDTSWLLRVKISTRHISVVRQSRFLPVQVCDGPEIEELGRDFSAWFLELFAAKPESFGLKKEWFEGARFVRVQCATGGVGPGLLGNSTLIFLKDGRLAMNYFDGTLIILKPLEGQ